MSLRGAIAILALAVVAFALAACAPPATPGVTVLRYASLYPPNHPFSRADQVWMAYVAKESGGTLRVRPYWGGALVSAESAELELRHGVADVALVTPIYARGGMQAVKTQTGFYVGARTIEEQVRVYRCLQKTFPVLDQELHGLRVLAVQGGLLPGILTRTRPVRTLDDLRGLRLRAPAETAPVIAALGVDAVTMPMGETYSALSKGVIDGVVAPVDTLKAMHFSEVGHYYSQLMMYRGAYPARAISDQAWARLTPAQQAVLARSTLVWEAALAQEIKRGEAAGLAFGHQQGVQFQPVSAADQARFDELTRRSARADARRLAPLGIDGEGMLDRAQAVIAADNAGRPNGC